MATIGAGAKLADVYDRLIGRNVAIDGDLMATWQWRQQVEREPRWSPALHFTAQKVRVEGNRYFNPGWHMALDLQTMLTVSEAITRSALMREESRGGHTRSDYPGTDPHFAKVNLVVRRDGRQMTLAEEPLPVMPDELKELAEGDH